MRLLFQRRFGMSKVDNISIGNCGEYFVAAELERQGFTAAIPMSNTKSFDVLAINRETNRQIAIQVKTNHTRKKSWTLSQKNEMLLGENIYYVFVCLNEKDNPDYYILPSYLVAKSISKSHTDFLNGVTTKDGKKGTDTTIRKFSFEIDKYNPYALKSDDYKSKWESLGKRYYELTKFLPIFDTDYFGEWYTDNSADGSFEHPFHLPCFSYDNNIEEFSSSVLSFMDNHPEMHLENFKDILRENSIEIETIKEVDCSLVDGRCICAMIIANVLAEKFCEGAILSSCKDRTFVKWLERLRELDEK